MKEHKRNDKKKEKPVFTPRRSLGNGTQAGLVAALMLVFRAHIPACFPLWLQLSSNLRTVLYLPIQPTLLPGSNTMDCDWVWSVCICTKDRPRREAGPGGLRGRGALHQDPGWNRQKQACPGGRWFGGTEWTPLTSPDEPKSWLESGGNLGKACTTGLPHVGPPAAPEHPILLHSTWRATKSNPKTRRTPHAPGPWHPDLESEST